MMKKAGRLIGLVAVVLALAPGLVRAGGPSIHGLEMGVGYDEAGGRYVFTANVVAGTTVDLME